MDIIASMINVRRSALIGGVFGDGRDGWMVVRLLRKCFWKTSCDTMDTRAVQFCGTLG